jgi:DNA-binding SARP family transcriptional activator/tetratricopeptide (TPR) repeat protein
VDPKAYPQSVTDDLEFHILGPVEVTMSGRPVHLTGRQRALCAALLLDPGQVVSLDRIVRRLWDERPPAAAGGRVRSLVAELRRLLGAEGRLVVTRPPGYLIDIDPQRVDLTRFERHLAAASRAVRDDPVAALAEYEAALALWRGEPLTDLEWAPERQSLAELRAEAVEGRLEAALSLGRYDGLVAETSRHVEEYPLRERPHALLMRALHGGGRTAEALEVYAAFRRSMVEELGIEPSAELAELQRQLLSGTMTPTSPSNPGERAEPGVPRQLPPITSLFVGRETELRRLDELRARDEQLIVISGPAGAGKSTLALRWARDAARHFPDGQIFLDMRGFDRAEAMTPREALPLLLRGLGTPSRDVPPTRAGQIALYRTMVADRRILLVLDDVADRNQVQDLLPGGEGTLTLITSRNSMSGLTATTGATRIECDVLDPATSVGLLGRALGAERVSAEPAAAARLAELCDHLPLALCVAASQIADDTVGGIGRFVTRLLERGRLAELSLAGEEHAAVRAALDASYQMLPPIGQVVHRSLGLLPGTGRSVAAIAAAVDLGRDTVEDAVRAAARLHLLRSPAPGMVAWHDLVQEHANERLRAETSAADQAAATRRLMEHYLHSAAAAARACGLARPGTPLYPAGTDDTTITFAGPAEAHAWFDAAWPEMAAAISYVAGQGPRKYAWLLVDSLRDLVQYRRPVCDLIRITEIGLGAAEADVDLSGQAAMQASAGQAAWRAGDLAAALAAFGIAGQLACKVGWPLMEARSEQGIGIVLKQMGEPEQALGHYRRAAAIAREAGDRLGEAGALNNLGSALLLLGRLREAEMALTAGLPLAARTDPHLHCLVLVNLGEVNTCRGLFDDALAMLDEALAVADTPSPYTRAVILENIGLAHVERDDFDTALVVLTEAVGLARQVENPTGETATLIGLADVAIAQNRYADAAQLLSTAERIADRIGVTAAQAATLRGQGALLLAEGRPREALGLLERARALAAAGSPLLLSAVRVLEAQAFARLGDTPAAVRAADEAVRLATESGQLAVRERASRLVSSLSGNHVEARARS